MNDKKLIVNADDFGFTQGINNAIVEGYRKGIITSCSLMTCAQYFEDAVEQIKDTPDLAVGVHLTLNHAKPVLPPGQIPFLVNRNGNFYNSPATLLQRLVLFPAAIQQAKAEFSHQILKMLDLGLVPSHLDTHKHMHLYFPLLRIIIQLASEFHINAIRVPYDSVKIQHNPPKKKISNLFMKSLYVVQKRIKRQLRMHAIKHNEYFFGMQFTGFLNEKVLIDVIESLPDGVTELMSHPGYCDDALMKMHTRLKESRHIEFEALISPRVKNCIERNNISLINYRQI